MSHTGVHALASLGKSFDENKPTIGPGTVIGGMMSKSSQVECCACLIMKELMVEICKIIKYFTSCEIPFMHAFSALLCIWSTKVSTN